LTDKAEDLAGKHFELHTTEDVRFFRVVDVKVS
jgi:hypothetical protein